MGEKTLLASSENNSKTRSPSPQCASPNSENVGDNGVRLGEADTPRATSKGMMMTTDGKPIAIPATDSHLGSPFWRAYPPDLAKYDISRETFLDFLDHLNRVSVASPPLVAVSVAATLTGFIPEPTVQVAALATDWTAQATTYGISKGRTEHLLRQANREIFGQHGLKVQIAKLEAVALLAGMPILDDEGKIIKGGAPLLAPLDDIHELHTLSGQQRRLNALQPWIAPLEVEEVASADRTKPRNPMSKMHIAVSEWQRSRGEENLMKGRRKALDSRAASRQKASRSFDEELQKVDEEEEKLREKAAKDGVPGGGEIPGDKAERLAEKRASAVQKFERDMAKAEKKFTEGNKEEKGIRKIYFLLVSRVDEVNAEGDPGAGDGEQEAP